MFASGILVGVGVSLLTAMFIKKKTSRSITEGEEYLAEVKIGQNYHSARIRLTKKKWGYKKCILM